MHHYFVNTCSSLALRGDVRQVWRDVIPQEGYNHAFVMHGILAVSALHKSLLTPSRRQEYLAVSAHHHVIGVEGFTLRLRQVNEDNWKPVFSFAALTILYVCLLPARCEHLTLTEPIPSILELFTVIRGMRSFLSPFFKNLDSTSFAPLHHGIWTHPEVEFAHGVGYVKPTLKFLTDISHLIDKAASTHHLTKRVSQRTHPMPSETSRLSSTTSNQKSTEIILRLSRHSRTARHSSLGAACTLTAVWLCCGCTSSRSGFCMI